MLNKSLPVKIWEIYSKHGLSALLNSAQSHIRNRASSYYIKNIYSSIFEYKHGNGEYIMRKDWDNLILLDACRYDIFNQHSTLNGKLTQVVSKGYYSYQFMKENFSGYNHHDTVYVTANPYIEKIEDDVFYTVDSVIDKWDSKTGTVLPKDVTEHGIKAAERYPNKRLIIHYMQPHLPHLGSIAQNINTEITGWDKYHANSDKEKQADGITMWQAYNQGVVSKNQLIESYIQTLNIVENQVKRLANELTGKTVISADHGENLGERYLMNEVFGHSQDTKECRLVPWLELDYDKRKDIVSESPIGYKKPDEDIDEKLRDLGYL